MELKDFTEKEQEMIKKRLTMSNISERKNWEEILASTTRLEIKQIPFCQKKHDNTYEIKHFNYKHPKLYAVAQTSGEIPEKTRRIASEIIKTLWTKDE